MKPSLAGRNAWRRRELSGDDVPAELSLRVLGQLGDFPAKAFDALVADMAAVVEYPDDPPRTFATSDPYVRRAAFGELGLVTYVIDDARRTVTLTDVTWTG